jgi:hypothetical protein
MQHNRIAALWICAVAMMIGSWMMAAANNPTACTDGPSVCTSANTCGGSSGTCTIQIIRGNLANGTVSPIINGNPTALQEFCVVEGNNVTWVTADATSFTDIRFPSNTYFGKSSFGSDSINSTTVTAANTGCSTFGISNCSYDGTQCGNSDPKVVIKGGQKRQPPPRRHKDEQ